MKRYNYRFKSSFLESLTPEEKESFSYWINNQNSLVLIEVIDYINNTITELTSCKYEESPQTMCLGYKGERITLDDIEFFEDDGTPVSFKDAKKYFYESNSWT